MVFKKQVTVLVDNGCSIYTELYDIEKVSLDEMGELFKEFVKSKGMNREC